MENVRRSQTVSSAVRQNSVSPAQGLLQRLFALWFDAFVYNQIWEDPAIDLAALHLGSESRVLTISSGGCNALNYLLKSPESITAVDLNKNHIYLLNLKKAAAANLADYNDFYQMFGVGCGENVVENYYSHIALKLDPETRRFWESGFLSGRRAGGKRIKYFSRGGIYNRSRNGYFLRIFHRLARLLGCRPEEVLKARSAAEQQALYEKHIKPFFDSWVLRAVGKMPVTLFGLGIPPQQYQELINELDENGSLVDIYRVRVKKLALDSPISENYFAWQAFGRKYDTARKIAVPEYLKESNFKILKQNLDRLNTSVCSITEELRKRPGGTFDRFAFLDAQDWMDGAGLIELWTLISQRAGRGARIIFRTAACASPVESQIPIALRRKFEYHRRESAELFKKDRASIYGGFHLYTVK